jgi:hypothetical protein
MERGKSFSQMTKGGKVTLLMAFRGSDWTSLVLYHVSAK